MVPAAQANPTSELAPAPTDAPVSDSTPVVTATPDAAAATLAQTAVDEARVEHILSQLTDDQKVGQLVMLGFGGTTADQATYLIQTYHPGSIVFWQNTQSPAQTQALTRGLQQLSADSGAGLPLFIAIDHEGGQVQRLTQGVTYFPSKRILGATYDPNLARLEGEVEGRELRVLGINMNLGPVLDVDSNPDNPIIGHFERSLGADPAVVAGLGVAYIQGLESQHVVGVAKHFPGHGDSRTDSHVGLPRLTLSLDQLRARELVPFAAAAQANVGAMMTAHLLFPNIDPTWPSSLSSVFVGQVLRRELGYDGLIMTDDMGGMVAITGNYTPGGAAVQAIVAGNDMAMVVGDAAREAQSVAALKGAVATGEIPHEQLDASVRRVLRAKLRAGILDDGDIPVVALPQPDADALQRVADGAITDVRDSGATPTVPAAASRGLVISADSLPRVPGGTTFGQAIRQRRPETTELVFQLAGDNSSVLPEALLRARTADFVIVATSDAGPWQQALVHQLALAGEHPIVVGFGSPAEVTSLPDDVPYLTAFLPRPEFVQAAAKVLFGELQPSGHLPIPVGPYPTGWNARGG
jgi:beta-N-acetylhexosaminidase